jgi:predicted RecB family nuclease
MKPTITSEVVLAYAQCPRKAYLLLFSPDQGDPHEYVRMLERQRRDHRTRYLDRLQQQHVDVQPYTVENLHHGRGVLINAYLQADGFAAVCDVLTRGEEASMGGTRRYEPTLCLGTHRISNEQKLAMAFAGYLLGRLQHTPPVRGRLIALDGTSHTVTLDQSAEDLRPFLDPLQAWTTGAPPAPPPVILNKHCPLCPFQRSCQAQAEQEDNLSLLDGVTARVMRQYAKKGIFTVTQLSYLFKPRKPRKRSRRPPPATHKLELQALAIREHKTYLQELPAVSRQPVELFLDIEGVPDRQSYYLIGLLVCQADTTVHYAFWADTAQDERHIWQQFVDKVRQFPDAPIYHYGSYEPRALAMLAKRYETDSEDLIKRLVNVHRYIYGKVYFPVRSNRLKDIGHFLGAVWTAPNASGLQSLLWRHHWEQTQEAHYRDVLVTYNREDCQALKAVTDELSKIQRSADNLAEVDFADQRKRQTTDIGEQIARQFRAILNFAHFDYDKKKIQFRREQEKESGEERQERNRRSAYKLHKKLGATQRKATKVVQIPKEHVCPRCGSSPLVSSKRFTSRTIVDLVPKKSGLKKSITEHIREYGYCKKCYKSYAHPLNNKSKVNQLYGHGLRAFVIYQRVALRLSYESIVEFLKEQFHENINICCIPKFIKDFAEYYRETERMAVQGLLESPFIHADETQINIKKSNWYVWVLTDGKRVIFKLTETREATFVHEFLSSYKGVLISDFYPGYDSVPCRQQKCWVHLIRDLNNDLLEAPFDTELENLVLQIKNLIIPIMECIQKHGLRQKNLQKFQKQVGTFYKNNITGKRFKSELALTYQKRFIRYRERLFTFLEHNELPWHNNTAERAIRHIAKQREISRVFGESAAQDYLVLLGLRQTCRFQNKSFFKFLFSGETDLDHFALRRRQR